MSEFRFHASARLTEATGRAAATVEELRDGFRAADGATVFHHTHNYLLQHHFLVPEPPNDLVRWAEEALGDRDLAARLKAVNTVAFSSLRRLQTRIVAAIEDRLREGPPPPAAPPGRDFHFLRARNFVFRTAYSAFDLPSFAAALGRASPASLFHHMFDAPLRLERTANDFSTWLETSLGERELAAEIAGLNPYSTTLVGLRGAILEKVDARLRAGETA